MWAPDLAQVLAPMAIGMAVFVCHLVAIPLDGCRCARRACVLLHSPACSCVRAHTRCSECSTCCAGQLCNAPGDGTKPTS